MPTKLSRMVTYVERFLPIKSYAHVITYSTTSPLFVNGKLVTNFVEKANP